MYFQFSTIFDKISAIFICLLLFIGNYIAPLFIFTETYHFVCNNDGQCEFYTTYLNYKSKNVTKYNLHNIKVVGWEMPKMWTFNKILIAFPPYLY